MKRLVFLIGGAAALALGACSGSNQDAVNNAEDQALGNQQQLNDENAAADDNGTNPSEAQEQNVDAM